MPEELNRRVDHLAGEVHGLREGVDAVLAELAEANDRSERAEARAVQAEARADRNRSWLWVLGSILVAAVLSGGLALGGAFYLINANNQKFCGILEINTDPSPPPTTDRGRSAQTKAEKLGQDLGCPQPPLTNTGRTGS